MFSNTNVVNEPPWHGVDQPSQNAPKKRGPKPKNEPAATVASHLISRD